MRRPWSFARRITVGFAASLAVALAIAASTGLALHSVLTSNEQLSADHVGHLAQVERLRRAFSEKLSAQRGQVLTGNASFREEARAVRRQFHVTLEELRSHAVGADEVRVLEAVVLAEAAHQEAADRWVMAREEGAPAERLEARMAQAQARTHQALEQLTSLTQERVFEGARRAKVAQHRALGLLIAVAVLGLLVATGLAWVLTRALGPLHHQAHANGERFRLLVEGVKDYALYLMDPEGRVASWNPGAERIQGWRAEEILDHSGSLLYTPEGAAEGQPGKDMERAVREGRLESEGWRLRKDGSRFWAETLLTPVRDEAGRLEGFVVLTRDITERGRMERAQRLFSEAERLFHAGQDPDLAVAELARVLVPELADGCMFSLLKAADELEPRVVTHVSREKEELLWELSHRCLSVQHSAQGVWQVLRTGQSERVADVTAEVRARMATDPWHLELIQRLGTRSWLIVPLHVGGRALGVLTLLSHRPERRFTETDQVFVEELAGRAALALDNARLMREAHAALELIGVAAHDLGNPLNALQLMLGKLRRTPPAEPEKLREVLTVAVRHTQRLGRLLHNLLDLSRLSSGKLDLELGEVDLAELVHEAAERHMEQAAEAGSPLELEVERGVVGRWDRMRLERVLTNLLSNAFKYGRGRPLQVRVERVEGHGRLVVRDHGPGIPLEQQRHIFDRFKKAVTSGEQKEGFGLGLYIVQQLVEAHGGTVRVDSTPGEGATFIVELPLVPVSREADGSPTTPGLLH